MSSTVAGLMAKSKYSHNIIRAGDIMTNAPFTILSSESGTTTIQLPLPLNLSSSTGANWQQEQVGMIKGQLMHNKDTTDALMGATSFKDALSILDKRMSSAITETTEDARALIARASQSKSKLGSAKVVLNPRNEMLFNGMQFKTYSFTFMLVPYEQADSDKIQRAIREIQKAAAPDLRGEKVFMSYPETWFVTFMAGSGNSGNNYLMKLNECCCTNIEVNYTPHGSSANMHENNAPLAVELSLNFTEIFIPTKDSIEEGFNG